MTQHTRVWRCHAFGDYHDLLIETAAQAAPAAHEITIRVQAFAPGFPDMLMVQGLYQLKPPLPFTPCSEFAGEVIAVGAGVKRFRRGDRVMGSVRYGAAADIVTAGESACVALPSAFDWAHGAAFLIGFKTAYVALVVRGQLRAEETVLVHGASGGVGLAAVQLAGSLGARVIATAAGAEKCALVRAYGADLVIDVSSCGFRDAVKAATGGRGVDVVYDPVGGDRFDESLRCIAPFGRVLVVGFASGRIPELKVNMALIKQLSIIGVRAGEYGRQNPAGGAAVDHALAEIAARGTLRPHICACLPFENLREAFEEIASRRVSGRIVVGCGQADVITSADT